MWSQATLSPLLSPGSGSAQAFPVTILRSQPCWGLGWGGRSGQVQLSGHLVSSTLATWGQGRVPRPGGGQHPGGPTRGSENLPAPKPLYEMWVNMADLLLD